MVRVILTTFCELLPTNIWELVLEVSLFFKSLTSPKLSAIDMGRLDEEIPMVLCNLETVFPPAFFDVIEHLPVHIAFYAMIAGLLHYIGRCIHLRDKVFI